MSIKNFESTGTKDQIINMDNIITNKIEIEEYIKPTTIAFISFDVDGGTNLIINGINRRYITLNLLNLPNILAGTHLVLRLNYTDTTYNPVRNFYQIGANLDVNNNGNKLLTVQQNGNEAGSGTILLSNNTTTNYVYTKSLFILITSL